MYKLANLFIEKNKTNDKQKTRQNNGHGIIGIKRSIEKNMQKNANILW